MAQRRTLTLTDAQRVELIDLRDHHPRPAVRERCAALLKVAEGHSPHWVARHGWLRERDPDTLYAWLDRYAEEGAASVTGHQQGGPQRRRL